MKRQVIYILKHNLLLQQAYKSIMSLFFRMLGRFVRTDPNTILFVSFMGSQFADSPRVIFEQIKSREEFKGFRFVWAFEQPDRYPQLDTVKIDTLIYFWTALKAKYWITNTNIERGLTFKKKDQIYLNTWHGVALKYIGNDCPGRSDYNFNTVDFLCVSGQHDEQVFKTAFNAKPESFLRCGMPRNDALWAADEKSRQELRKSLGIPENKKVILYAPTWRDSEDGGRSYTLKPPVNIERWKARLSEEYIVLFRAHHLTTKVLNLHFDDFIWDKSNYPTVNDLLIAADVLITDYSAIAFDYAILGKPILTFTYDYDSYLVERGTYFEMDKHYPNQSCRTEEELLNRICSLDFNGESEKTKAFCNEFMQYRTSATTACIDAILGSTKAVI